MVNSQISRCLLVASVILFSGCGRSLDTEKIAATIHSGITQQGGSSVKSVICPKTIKPEAGNRFECVGVLASGSGFAIAVNQQDDQGNIVWEVPSVRGLLNMVKLQGEVESALNREMGQVKVDCGLSLLRSVKPGEIFDCQLDQKNTKSKPKEADSNLEKSPAQSQSESDQKTSPTTVATTQEGTQNSSKDKPSDTIQVTIQPSGDVNWQRIIKLPAIASAATSSSDTSKAKANPSPASEIANETASSGAPSPAAAKSAEDFLNQPGAAEDFN